MPTGLRWGPYSAFCYSNEATNQPTSMCGLDREAKFWLTT